MEDSANQVSDFYLDSVKIELLTSNPASHLRAVKIHSHGAWIHADWGLGL